MFCSFLCLIIRAFVFMLDVRSLLLPAFWWIKMNIYWLHDDGSIHGNLEDLEGLRHGRSEKFWVVLTGCTSSEWSRKKIRNWIKNQEWTACPVSVAYRLCRSVHTWLHRTALISHWNSWICTVHRCTQVVRIYSSRRMLEAFSQTLFWLWQKRVY